MQHNKELIERAVSPGFVITALKGGSGKTISSIGIIAALKDSGKSVAPFKKGPDYIDAGWLALAAGRHCYNLDTFLIEEHLVRQSFLNHSINSDISVIEGNRGLYDGIEIDGRTSTAELAKLLNLPVILCLDCTKTTRTMAAAVLGCLHFDPDVTISGVILNRVAGPRHGNILRTSIEHHCGIPVVGIIPKIREQVFPERHMGLVPTPEHEWAHKSIRSAAKIAHDNIDLDLLVDISGSLGNKEGLPETEPVAGICECDVESADKPKIGIIRDSAFQFYYPENIEALISEGAELVYLSPLKDTEVPDIDALYIGGGFPETHAPELAENESFRNHIKSLAQEGFPIYAECGGLMYMGRELILNDTSYPMTGIFPLSFTISKKPQGHGYVVVEVSGSNPYFEVGTEIKGHEFRYSKVIGWDGSDTDMAFSMKRGVGIVNNRDGVCFRNVLATYAHIHALGTPSWARAIIRKANEWKESKSST